MVLILNEQSAWLYSSIWKDSLKVDYPFQRACVQPPLSSEKIGDGMTVREGRLQTANNKIPVSSVFNDSEGLYRTTVCRCLVQRPHYSARLMRFGSPGPSECFSQIRHWTVLTEIVWEDAEHELGMAMSIVASEKNRELLFIGNVFYNQWHLWGVVSLVFRGHDLL